VGPDHRGGAAVPPTRSAGRGRRTRSGGDLVAHGLTPRRRRSTRGAVIHAVRGALQQLASAGVDRPVICTSDYLEATARLPADHRLALTGHPETTPWDAGLQTVMIATDVAVQEEAIVDLLLADLRES
jgi:hypothetical protein